MDLLRAALLGAVLAVGGSSAMAQTQYTISKYQTSFTTRTGIEMVRDGSARAGALATTASRGIVTAAGMSTVTDAVILTGRTGAVAVAASSGIAVADAAVAIASAALLPEAIAVGSAAYLVWSAYKTYNEGGAMKTDPGQPAVIAPCYSWYFGDQRSPYATHSGCVASREAAANAIGSAADSDYSSSTGGTYPTTYTETHSLGTCTESASSWACNITYTRTTQQTCTGGCAPSVTTTPTSVSGNVTTGSSCPASTDAFNPAYNVPAGMAAYPDGSCPTARGNHAATTPAELAAKVVAHPGYATPTNFADALRKSIENGATPLSTPGAITGPASVTSPSPTTTTTTGPAGTTTTTTTPRDNYTYTPPKISITPSDITTTTAPDGTTTTTTTSGGGASDTRPECDKTPDVIGCQKMDAPPEVPWEPTNKDVTLTAASPWGGDGSCPADRTLFSVGSIPVVWSWSLVCQFFSGIRFAVIACAWLGAIFIFIGARNDA